MKQVINQLVKSARRNELFWRYGFNFGSTFNYKISGSKREKGKASEVIAELNANGYSMTTLDDLFPGEGLGEKLNEGLDELLANWQEKIDSMRTTADDESLVGQKIYSVELLGNQITFDPESIFTRFALQETLLNIANAYLGMYAKLRYYNIWYTLPTKIPARESQLWHYDREDNYILKTFVYLKDIDEGAGPFTYAPGTHRKGEFKNLTPENFNEKGVLRTTDEQMNQVFPKEKWIKGIGKKGTIIFADTRGYHKGGEARTKDRLMYTCMYTSAASQSKKLIKYPSNLNTGTLSDKQLNALYF